MDLSDLIEYRTGLARELGANIPPAEALKWELENDYPNMYNRTRYDVVIETTGVAQVFANGLNLLKPGGYLGCVGMIKTAEIPQKLIVTKSLTVTGSIGGTEEFEGVIAFIQENRDAVRKLISMCSLPQRRISLRHGHRGVKGNEDQHRAVTRV